MTKNIEEMLKILSSYTVLELNDLRNSLKEAWGVSDAAPVAVAAAAPVQAQTEAKTEFDVLITAVDPSKTISVIKTLRETNPELGLAEAKNKISVLPVLVKQGISAKDANECKEKLQAAGATVEVK